MLKDVRRVNDEGASGVDLVVVIGDSGAREDGGESKPLGRGEVGLLEADDVASAGEIKEGRRDKVTAREQVRGGGIIREAVYVIGDNTWNEEGRGGEGEGGRGGHDLVVLFGARRGLLVLCV